MFLANGELDVSGLVNCSYMKLVLTVEFEFELGRRLEWKLPRNSLGELFDSGDRYSLAKE